MSANPAPDVDGLTYVDQYVDTDSICIPIVLTPIDAIDTGGSRYQGPVLISPIAFHLYAHRLLWHLLLPFSGHLRPHGSEAECVPYYLH